MAIPQYNNNNRILVIQEKMSQDKQTNKNNVQELSYSQKVQQPQSTSQSNYNLLDYDQQFNAISFKDKSADLIDLLTTTTKQEMGIAEYNQFLRDRILEMEGPSLVSDGILTSYKLYTIKSRKIKSKTYDTSVSRRFSDFEYLQNQLIEKKGGCIIPLLPQKNLWASLNWQGNNFAANRHKGLLKYIQALLAHQKLKLTPEVRNFLFFDQMKFSQGKGEFVQQIKTQDKVKLIASNAYNFGFGIVQKFWNSSKSKPNELVLANPTKDDLLLSEYEILINQFIRITGSLRKLVQCSVQEMQIVNEMMNRTHLKNSQKDDIEQISVRMSIIQQFEELGQYIESCSSAISRRKTIRLQLQQLRKQEKNVLNRAKNNPRSQQMDLIRGKLNKVSTKCDNYTVQLLQQLSKSIYLGRSMIQKFISKYSNLKSQFYRSQ